MFRFTIRAALLDGSIYEELRERRETTFHALLSVLIAAAGFGLGIWSAQSGTDAAADRNYSLFVAISTTFTGWFLWALLVWLLAKVLFQGEAGFRATVRCIGVCYAPLALWILLDVPVPYLGGVALVTGSGLATGGVHRRGQVRPGRRLVEGYRIDSGRLVLGAGHTSGLVRVRPTNRSRVI